MPKKTKGKKDTECIYCIQESSKSKKYTQAGLSNHITSKHPSRKHKETPSSEPADINEPFVRQSEQSFCPPAPKKFKTIVLGDTVGYISFNEVEKSKKKGSTRLTIS